MKIKGENKIKTTEEYLEFIFCNSTEYFNKLTVLI